MKISVTIIFSLCISALSAQILPYNPVFDDTKINSIYISIDDDSLTQLYSDIFSDHEYSVSFVYDDGITQDTLQNVGFRLRGNTSRGAAKKSFKISFNTFDEGRKYQGLEKMNLNGSHNDPSMIREKLYFDVYNLFGLPVRRCAFVKVYINDIYYGLYINIEEYDEIFIKDRFGENTGNLYKCTWPADLTYDGSDPASYYNAYDLQMHEDKNDYSAFIHFLDVLNNTPDEDFACELGKIFDIDNFLKIYALDVCAGHWDNYGFNQNNFYLYQNQFTGRFEFLSYDCDNTFGIDWVGEDWTDRNIYTWENSPRPLVERLLNVPEYRMRFGYYTDQLIHGILSPENINPHIDSLHTLIAPAALDDVFRTYDYGYTFTDFNNSFTTNNIDGHTPYGIENFIAARDANSETQLEEYDIAPIIKNEMHVPFVPSALESTKITAEMHDEISVVDPLVHYSYNGGAENALALYDDATHGDSIADDHIFTALLPPAGENGTADYYFTASDISGNTTTYPVCDAFSFPVGFTPPSVVINEWMAANSTTIQDDFGNYSDYIELYNAGGTGIFLGDKFMSDEPDNPGKWQLPQVWLDPDSYLLIWADDSTELGTMHAAFKLNAGHDEVGMYTSASYGFSAIDSFSFHDMLIDHSRGRLPNGTGSIVDLPHTTPGYNNEEWTQPIDTVYQDNAWITGNLLSENALLSVSLSADNSVQISVFSVNGELVRTIADGTLPKGIHTFSLDDKFPRALYLIRIVLPEKTIVLRYVS